MKNFLASLSFVLSALVHYTTPAQAQPAQWNYSSPANVATATYPGDVVILGNCTGCAPAGAGTVTSVGLSLPSGLFTVTGSPVTTLGTLTGALKTQVANTVFAGPSTGADAAPTFRALVASDIPTLSLTINGTSCIVGTSCTVTAAAGTLTGNTLASNVLLSSLTSVGTITSGTWNGTAITNTYIANPSTTVNGQVCVLGSTCTITAVAGSVTVGTTTISGGTNGRILYDASGLLGEKTLSCADLTDAGSFCNSTNAANLTGSLPAISGASLTNLNASNLASGTVPAARLPNPSASTLGGIQSYAAVSNQWINAISTSGVPSSAQPSCSNLSGVAASCSTDATNAANISSGTLAVARGGTGLTSTVNFRGIRATSTQSLTSSTMTKVQLNSITIDTGSYWDGANFYFKPLVAGTYMACGGIYVTSAGLTALELIISKNGTSGSGGTEIADSNYPAISASSWSATVPCSLVAMNGSTDTLELDVYATGTTPVVQSVRSTSQMSIRLVSP